MKKLLALFLFVVAGTFLCGNALALSTYIPHITGGSADWTDYLQVNNNSPSAANFTLILYNKGNQVYSQTLTVGALSRSQIALKALNSNAETGIITYTEPGLVFRVSYSSWAGGIAEFRTIDILGSNVGFYFSDFTNFVQWKGSAIANMGTTPAQVTLYALGGSSGDSGGSILGTHTETINPKEKIVGTHSAWFNVDLSRIESIVAVTTSSSLCGIAIGGDTALSRLLFTPAIPVTNFISTIYTQADLTGTWNINVLETGSNDRWMRGTATVDSSGFVTLSFIDSGGNILLPAANSIRWTIDAHGEISGSGLNEADQVHMTMTSNRNLIVGTGTASGKQLRIMQKMVPGTAYSNADVQGRSFAYHQLGVGEAAYAGWEHGTGTTDAAGLMTLTTAYDPAGPLTTGATGITLSVNESGVVTMSPGKDTFRGFLSDDKRTIVGTQSSPGGSVLTLVVFQIIGQTYPAGPLPVRISASHMLAGGSTSPAPFWLHYTLTVASGGLMNFSDWVTSNPMVTPPATACHGWISASGAVTIAEIPSFHGQASPDGKFTVSTQTNANGIHSLAVNTW